MNRNQWIVLGFALMFIAMFFIGQDTHFESVCNKLRYDFPSLDRSQWCINTEIYDPFIYSFGMLVPVCWILGYLEKKKGGN